MKLFIQIPCYNEEKTLEDAIRNIPRKIDGVDEIKLQIINDGSTDNTVQVAKKLGVDFIVDVPGKNRRWLGRAFSLGIKNALLEGADIVVNTDGDNQYPAEKIPELINPILKNEAQIVIGDRNPSKFKEFSLIKRFLQKLGNAVLKFLTREDVKDAVSGFRADSKEALLKLNITTNYTYTVDTLMQAYKKGIDVAWIEITPNPKTRESRLIKNIFEKTRRSGTTICRVSMVYTPFKTFLTASLIFLIPSLILLVRFFYFYFTDGGKGNVQSVVIGAVFLAISFQVFILGIIADLISINRHLLEDALYRIKNLEIKEKQKEKE